VIGAPESRARKRSTCALDGDTSRRAGSRMARAWGVISSTFAPPGWGTGSEMCSMGLFAVPVTQ
jgi:hypothetical protein